MSESPVPPAPQSIQNPLPAQIVSSPAPNVVFVQQPAAPSVPEISPAAKKWSLRILIIVLALLFLQIPLLLVSQLSEERRENSLQASGDIAASWGPAVQLLDISSEGTAPDTLNIKAELSPEVRYRGIYQTVVYTADVEIKADFVQSGKSISLDFVNLKSILDCSARVNGKDVSFVQKGDSIILNDLPAAGRTDCVINLKMRGTEFFQVIPCGRQNNVTVSGAWDSPNFGESSFLPGKRTVSDDEFSAEWQLLNFRKEFEKSGNPPVIEVRLFIPAGTYQQVERTITYATFFLIVFFFTLVAGEFLTGITIHPLQYVVASGAPVLFYLMLLAISEKTGFQLGYLISAAVITLMISGYARMFFARNLPAFIIGLVFALGYAVNYFILQMEDWALLGGTIILAVILGVLMLITGRINRKKMQTDSGK